jgi:hypothetical protein
VELVEECITVAKESQEDQAQATTFTIFHHFKLHSAECTESRQYMESHKYGMAVFVLSNFEIYFVHI